MDNTAPRERIISSSTTIGDRAEIVQILQLAMEGETPGKFARRDKGADLNELLLSEDIRLRYRYFDFPVNNIRGVITRERLIDMLGASIHDAINGIMEEQEGGQWAIAAYELVSTSKRRARRRKGGSRKLPLNDLYDKGVVGVPSEGQNSSIALEEEEVVRVCVAFYDQLRMAEVDTWMLRTGKRTPQSDLIEQGLLPTGLLDQWKRCRDLMARWMEFRGNKPPVKIVQAHHLDMVKKMNRGAKLLYLCVEYGIDKGDQPTLAKEITAWCKRTGVDVPAELLKSTSKKSEGDGASA